MLPFNILYINIANCLKPFSRLSHPNPSSNYRDFEIREITKSHSPSGADIWVKSSRICHLEMMFKWSLVAILRLPQKFQLQELLCWWHLWQYWHSVKPWTRLIIHRNNYDNHIVENVTTKAVCFGCFGVCQTILSHRFPILNYNSQNTVAQGNYLTLSLLSSKSVFSQPFKKRLYEWCSENL